MKQILLILDHKCGPVNRRFRDDRFCGPFVNWTLELLPENTPETLVCGILFPLVIVLSMIRVLLKIIDFCLRVIVFFLSTLVEALLFILRLNKRSKRTLTCKPPLNAEFLFYLFLDKHNCDALVGDLEERHRLILKTFGRRRANFWYWTQAIRSVGPIVLAWAKKSAVKPGLALVSWALARGVLGHDSWLAAVVEAWRKIRS